MKMIRLGHSIIEVVKYNRRFGRQVDGLDWNKNLHKLESKYYCDRIGNFCLEEHAFDSCFLESNFKNTILGI